MGSVRQTDIAVEVLLHAILADMTGKKGKFRVTLEPGSRAAALLEAIGLCEDDVGMIVVGGCVVAPEFVLSDDMQVELFPPLSGG